MGNYKQFPTHWCTKRDGVGKQNIKTLSYFLLRSSTNGSCLYNAASILLYGNESTSRKLRLLTSIELFSNADYCSEHPEFTRARKYSKYSDNSLFILAISEATASNFNPSLKNKAQCIHQEAIRNCEDSSCASFVYIIAICLSSLWTV